jgi:predicted kinase
MVCSALRNLSVFKHEAPEIQDVLHAAAILHDCAKPETCSIDENGRISNRNHAPRGAIKARQILWEMGVPFAQREAICNLIRFHMRPFHFLNSPRMDSYIAQISWSARTDLLKILATADTLGRISKSKADNLEVLDAFEAYCKELYCWGKPCSFASDYVRVAHFNDGQDLLSQARPPLSPTVFVMSGLPGAGKDHYIKRHFDLPVVSLDDIRSDLKVAPNATGEVIQVANKKARVLLAKGQDFVWNATNVSKMVRQKCLSLMRQYGAKISIIYVESSYDEYWRQNKIRDKVVPKTVIQRLLSKWEVPDLTEAHELTYVVCGKSWPA